MTIRITGDGPKITATGSGSTVLVEISTGQHDPGSFSGVHNDLTGRSTTGAHVGTAVSIDPTGFNGNLDGTITNAQLLAAAVDDLTTGGGGGGGGVTDHGLLTGLSDDDHTQYAKKASNLSDLASAATARTNLGLGTAAVAATGDFDAAGTAAGLVDDLSGVSNQATARTNLGLGSAAVEAASAFAAAGDLSTHTGLTTTAHGGIVPSTRTVNSKALSSDITLTAADVGAVSGNAVVAASKVQATTAYGSPLYPPVATSGPVAVGLGDMVAIAASGAPATLAKVGYEVTATSATAGQVCKLGCYAVNTDGSIGTLTWSEDLPADAVASVMRTLSTTRAVPELRAWVILNPFANAGSVTFRAWSPHPSHVGITSVYHNRFGFGLSASITALPSDLSDYKFNYTDSAGPSYWGHNNYLAMPCLVGVT